MIDRKVESKTRADGTWPLLYTFPILYYPKLPRIILQARVWSQRLNYIYQRSLALKTQSNSPVNTKSRATPAMTSAQQTLISGNGRAFCPLTRFGIQEGRLFTCLGFWHPLTTSRLCFLEIRQYATAINVSFIERRQSALKSQKIGSTRPRIENTLSRASVVRQAYVSQIKVQRFL